MKRKLANIFIGGLVVIGYAYTMAVCVAAIVTALVY